MADSPGDVVLAITGASGAVFGVRLLEVLVACGQRVQLTISPAACQVLEHELGYRVDLQHFDAGQLLKRTDELPEHSPYRKFQFRSLRGSALESSSIFNDSVLHGGEVRYHNFRDYRAGIASGSFLTRGMVICPCSMGTLSAIATGQSQNLVHRAADVHIKERRKLIVVPRETPLSPIALGNMQRLAELGVIVLPAMPGWYHQPTTLGDLVDFVVARVCDQLGVRHSLMQRWGGDAETTPLPPV